MTGSQILEMIMMNENLVEKKVLPITQQIDKSLTIVKPIIYIEKIIVIKMKAIQAEMIPQIIANINKTHLKQIVKLLIQIHHNFSMIQPPIKQLKKMVQ